jgi:hypothetical protein
MDRNDAIAGAAQERRDKLDNRAGFRPAGAGLRHENEAGQTRAAVEPQIDRLLRAANNVLELRNRVAEINRRVRGPVPETGAIKGTAPDPDMPSLVTIVEGLESLVSQCHEEVTELSAYLK